MRVLVACEFSGVVRDAFRRKGHEAWSCDLESAEDNSPFHIQGDALDALKEPWDLMIAHPPCTYLCNAGVRWLAPGGVLEPERHILMQKACDFFAALYWADVPLIAVENPIMHKYARDYLQSVYKVPRQTMSFQPWEHGHGETKRTCLWLRGLRDLRPSSIALGRVPRVHLASPGKDRWKVRSRTLPGIAQAMAEQWAV